MKDFGPYRILRKIATGGMAEVYLARQRGLEGIERTVVLKRMLDEYASRDEFVTMFLDEARLLASLSHPNISQVFALERVHGRYVLVMEFVHGPTLWALMQAALRRGEGGLPEREALAVGLALADALRYVHNCRDDRGRPLRIVHRDLNPANVIVSYDGSVKLIDFGIAKATSTVHQTRAGVVKGTFGYMAPEQVYPTYRTDHRADLFAVGVLLYEMCLGRHPFAPHDEDEAVERMISGRFPRPKSLDPNFPTTLAELIVQCLKPIPNQRLTDMEELIEGLTHHLSAHGRVPSPVALSRMVERLVPDEDGPVPVQPMTEGAEQIWERHTTQRVPAQVRDRIVQHYSSLPPHDSAARSSFGSAAGTPLSVFPAGVGRDWSESNHEESRHAQPAPSKGARDFLRSLTPPNAPAASTDGRTVPGRPAAQASSAEGAGVAVSAGPAQPIEGSSPGAASAAQLRTGWSTRALVAATLLGAALSGLALWAAPRFIATQPGIAAQTQPAQGAVPFRVESRPEGASIRLNGEVTELQTPATLYLPAGADTVRLLLTLEGYRPLRQDVTTELGVGFFRLTPLD